MLVIVDQQTAIDEAAAVCIARERESSILVGYELVGTCLVSGKQLLAVEEQEFLEVSVARVAPKYVKQCEKLALAHV